MENNKFMTKTNFENFTQCIEVIEDFEESSEVSDTSSSMSDIDFEGEYPHLLELAFACRNRVQMTGVNSTTNCRRGGVMIAN